MVRAAIHGVLRYQVTGLTGVKPGEARLTKFTTYKFL